MFKNSFCQLWQTWLTRIINGNHRFNANSARKWWLKLKKVTLFWKISVHGNFKIFIVPFYTLIFALSKEPSSPMLLSSHAAPWKITRVQLNLYGVCNRWEETVWPECPGEQGYLGQHGQTQREAGSCCRKVLVQAVVVVVLLVVGVLVKLVVVVMVVMVVVREPATKIWHF